MSLSAILGSLKTLGRRADQDSIDEMHYFWTTNLLIALSVLVSYKQFGGKPLECLIPPKFPGPWEDYAENYCWAQDTYYLPWDSQVPQAIEEREAHEISYYQWVPFFLLIQAACFRLPSLIWKYLAGHSGIKIHDIVKIAVDEKNVEPQCKQANIQSLTIHLQNALRFHRRLYRKKITPHRMLRFLNLPYTAFFVSTMYLLTKLLYLINVCLQLWFMNRFMGTDKSGWYGFGVIQNLWNGTTWEHSGVFPRVTLCDFQVRVMGNLQRYSVQCVLVINIFNEKIFVFLWFWYAALMFLTALSFVYWVIVTVLPCFGRWFISRHLELSEMPFDPRGSKKDVERFVCSYLKTDGIFVLRMITMHSGIIFGTDLVLSLWKCFYGLEDIVKRSDSAEAAAHLLTPTPPATENTLNFLNLRKRLKRRKSDGDDEKEEEENRKARQKAKELDNQDDLTERLLPPTSKNQRPTAPQATLDMPDSRATTIEMHQRSAPPSLPPKPGHEDYLNSGLAERRGSASLKLKMPNRDLDSDEDTTRGDYYSTARNRPKSVDSGKRDGLGSKLGSPTRRV